jgi:hypothetical protein
MENVEREARTAKGSEWRVWRGLVSALVYPLGMPSVRKT